MNTQRCRAHDSWKQVGTTIYTLSKFVYRVPCISDTRIVEQLGAVKKRSDGRWNWWRFKSKFHKSWSSDQGVANNQGAAEMRVLDGWNE